MTVRDNVSVILTYRNRADTLTEAARSVLDQTHRELTLYLVDDASTDASREMAAALKDDRIIHLHLSANAGVSGARNAGLEQATDSLVAFMDSDDVWRATKLELQVAALRVAQEYARVSVVGCGWEYMTGVSAPATFATGPFTKRDVLSNQVAGIGTPMLLVDTTVATPARFDTSLPALVDRDFVMSCLANGSQVVIVPEVLARVRRGRTDHVANTERAARAYELLVEKYDRELDSDPALRSWYHFRACREHLRRGGLTSAFRHVRPALGHFRLRRGLHLLAALFGRSKGLAVAQRIAPL